MQNSCDPKRGVCTPRDGESKGAGISRVVTRDAEPGSRENICVDKYFTRDRSASIASFPVGSANTYVHAGDFAKSCRAVSIEARLTRVDLVICDHEDYLSEAKQFVTDEPESKGASISRAVTRDAEPGEKANTWSFRKAGARTQWSFC